MYDLDTSQSTAENEDEGPGRDATLEGKKGKRKGRKEGRNDWGSSEGREN